MDRELSPSPLLSRKAFWFGFAMSLGACTLAACLVYSDEIGQIARATVTQVQSRAPAAPTPPPPAVDEAGAQARLNKAAGIALAFPFPDPQLILTKAYGELDLFYGERFVKRYNVQGAAGAAAGIYAVLTQQPPPPGQPLRIGLAGCAPTSATAAMRLRGGGTLPSGKGQMEIVGIKTPAPPAGGSAGTQIPPGGTPELQPPPEGGAPQVAPAAAELKLNSDDAAELYTALHPGALVLVVEQ